MQGYAIRSVTVSGASVVNAHSIGQGLSTSLVALASRASDTENPSLASASACLRLAGVIRFRVPSSSSLPQRPQLESSVCQRTYSACVTRGWGVACCARARSPGSASVARMTPVKIRAELPTISVLITTSKVVKESRGISKDPGTDWDCLAPIRCTSLPRNCPPVRQNTDILSNSPTAESTEETPELCEKIRDQNDLFAN